MRVLVTRPLSISQTLCEKIKALGAIAEPFPVIEIRPTPHQTAVQWAIEHLPTFDMAIFVSRPAVDFTLPAIQSRWCPTPSILWAAIGPGTAETLKKYGIAEIILPKSPPFETETLLATEAFQAVSGKQILIFRGNGGRALLSDVLQKRGAVVQAVEVYQRHLPTLDSVATRTRWYHTKIDVIVTTSAECLYNLILLIGKEAPWLKETPLIVVGQRMYKLANQLEFKKPLLAMGADDASIIQVLTTFKDRVG